VSPDPVREEERERYVRALVIDDSKAVRRILGEILQELGFEVWEAANGREALRLLKEVEAADLALVDWNMPEMDGIEFVRAVRADTAYDDLRLIMVTTEAEEDKVVGALNEGADAYVVKPFTKATIVQKLDVLGVQTL
jgi:two-component system chemotaxis response regulator CheY